MPPRSSPRITSSPGIGSACDGRAWSGQAPRKARLYEIAPKPNAKGPGAVATGSRDPSSIVGQGARPIAVAAVHQPNVALDRLHGGETHGFALVWQLHISGPGLRQWSQAAGETLPRRGSYGVSGARQRDRDEARGRGSGTLFPPDRSKISLGHPVAQAAVDLLEPEPGPQELGGTVIGISQAAAIAREA